MFSPIQTSTGNTLHYGQNVTITKKLQVSNIHALFLTKLNQYHTNCQNYPRLYENLTPIFCQYCHLEIDNNSHIG
jgi:hypothetical protein